MAESPELRHPHDAFFKETFGRTDIAADYLRHYLPESVAALLRLDALEPQRETFVDEELQEHFSDLLYRVPLLESEQQDESLYVYTLFEHKSYPDRLVAYQLLRYMLRIWERTLPTEQKLVPILPIVFYHGESRWQLRTNFTALFAGPEELRRYWPAFDYHLTDLSQYQDEQIKGAVFLQGVLLLLKHVRDEDAGQQLVRIVRMMADWLRQQSGVEWLYTLLRYVTAAGPQVSESDVRQMVEVVFPHRSRVIMATLAEKWLEEGKQEGKQEGLELGLEQGAQALRNTITGILRLRFGLSEHELENVAEQLSRISDIKRLEELSL